MPKIGALLQPPVCRGTSATPGAFFRNEIPAIAAGCGEIVHLTALTAAGVQGGSLERPVLRLAGMVRLTVALNATSARGVQDLLEAFRFLMTATRLEPGCLGCAAWVDLDSTVHYEEEWAAEADLQHRVRTPAFTSVLAVMESAQGPPRVQFDFVTKTRGLDYVAEVRGQLAQ
jgi:quinol monooxygenase YgiN